MVRRHRGERRAHRLDRSAATTGPASDTPAGKVRLAPDAPVSPATAIGPAAALGPPALLGPPAALLAPVKGVSRPCR